MPAALRLEAGADGLALLTFDLPDRKVNLLTREVLAELEAMAAELRGRTDIAVLLLVSAKPDVFIAGADLGPIEAVTDPDRAEAGARLGQRLFASWEALPFPTVAAIRGACLGGGTELALASTWIAVSDRPDLRIGLPEVRFGILPAWGGCTRLPRRIGLQAALEVIVATRELTGARALAVGLADALLPDADFLARVREFALARVGRRRRSHAGRGLRALLLESHPAGRRVLLAGARRRALARTGGRYPAPLAALEVIATGLDLGRSAGFDAEARAVARLAVSSVAKNLIHVFRLNEAARRAGAGPEPTPVRRPAVVGAGARGAAIALLIADRTDLPVRLRDVRAEALAAALRHATEQLGERVRRKGLTPGQMRHKLALLQPTLEDSGLATCDFLLAAVPEDLAVLQELFAGLDRRAPLGALLVSTTGSHSIDAIGLHAAHRGRIVGLHFLHPIATTPLVEVVVGRHTAPAGARAAAAFVRRLGRTPLAVRDGPGFLVDRLLMFCLAEALWLLDEGHRIEEIDLALVRWGLSMGPLRRADEAGLDVSIRAVLRLAGALGDRLPLPPWLDRLAAGGEPGRARRRGFYRSSEHRPRPRADRAVYAELGLAPARGSSDPEALAERLVLPMVQEAAVCLEEGVVEGPGAIDLALILGAGFPAFRGGLCRWADELGLEPVIGKLDRLAREVGARHRPAAALRRFAAAGGFYAATG